MDMLLNLEVDSFVYTGNFVVVHFVPDTGLSDYFILNPTELVNGFMMLLFNLLVCYFLT